MPNATIKERATAAAGPRPWRAHNGALHGARCTCTCFSTQTEPSGFPFMCTSTCFVCAMCAGHAAILRRMAARASSPGTLHLSRAVCAADGRTLQHSLTCQWYPHQSNTTVRALCRTQRCCEENLMHPTLLPADGTHGTTATASSVPVCFTPGLRAAAAFTDGPTCPRALPCFASGLTHAIPQAACLARW